MGNHPSHSEENKEIHHGPETTNNYVDLHQKVDQLPTHTSQYTIVGISLGILFVVLICYCFMHRMFKRYCKFLLRLATVDNIKQHIQDSWKPQPNPFALLMNGQAPSPSVQLPMQFQPPAPVHHYPAISPTYAQPMPLPNAPSVAINMEPQQQRAEPEKRCYEEKSGLFNS